MAEWSGGTPQYDLPSANPDLNCPAGLQRLHSNCCHNANPTIKPSLQETMLRTIFKQKETSDSSSQAIQHDESVKVTRPEMHATLQSAAKVEWEEKLQSAMNNDVALLAVAKDAPMVDIKLTAVLALKDEASLKLAEREFRTHDRRVHRAAKQRYESLVEKRESREQANRLIETAANLVNESIIPANRLVELDQAWRTLDPALLEDMQIIVFTGLQSKLTTLMRERGDYLRNIQRWTANANQALNQLNASCATVAAGSKDWAELASTLASASTHAQNALQAAPATTSSALPDSNAAAQLVDALQISLHKAEQIQARLNILNELYQGDQPVKIQPDDVQADANGSNSDIPPAVASTPSQRWQALPITTDARIDRALNAHFETWQHIKDDAKKTRQIDNKKRASEKKMAAQQQHIEALEAVVTKAESTLAAGHLAETGKHLVAIQKAPGSSVASGALQARILALQAEFTRLKEWMQWGGGRVRDDLAQEAEALAKTTIDEEGKRAIRLPVKQLADSIEQLRLRWKELDRLGGASHAYLWQRFDTALRTAYMPVAEHLAKVNAERQENLTARKKMIDVLNTLHVTNEDNGAATDWRGIARALDHFKAEWRKLGPIEHTVPHKARGALLEQMKYSIERLENPLREARRLAQLTREEFIARANALSSSAQNRDLVAKVRVLQTEWQQHAKLHPLERKIENALWANFKIAIDVIFSQRSAAFSAKEHELKANQAIRKILIARIEALNQDTPPAEIKQTVENIQTEWRNTGEAPKSEAAKLDEKFRAACQKALLHITGSSQRIWHTTCDSLLAKLALCEEREANTQPDSQAADSNTHWSTLPTLPALWEKILQNRLNSGESKPADESLNTILLQLEYTLDMPSQPEFQDARRALKLNIMKNVMEGRDSADSTKTDIEKLLSTALGYSSLNSTQHKRLITIIATLRSGQFEVHANKIRPRRT